MLAGERDARARGSRAPLTCSTTATSAASPPWRATRSRPGPASPHGRGGAAGAPRRERSAAALCRTGHSMPKATSQSSSVPPPFFWRSPASAARAGARSSHGRSAAALRERAGAHQHRAVEVGVVAGELGIAHPRRERGEGLGRRRAGALRVAANAVHEDVVVVGPVVVAQHDLEAVAGQHAAGVDRDAADRDQRVARDVEPGRLGCRRPPAPDGRGAAAPRANTLRHKAHWWTPTLAACAAPRGAQFAALGRPAALMGGPPRLRLAPLRVARSSRVVDLEPLLQLAALAQRLLRMRRSSSDRSSRGTRFGFSDAEAAPTRAGAACAGAGTAGTRTRPPTR